MIRKFNGSDGRTAWVLTHIDAVMTDDGRTLRDVLKSLTGFDPAYIAQMDNIVFLDDLKGFFSKVAYDASTSSMLFQNSNGETVATFDTTPIIAEGILEDVTFEDGNLIFTFISGGETKTVTASVSELFNPDNYYTKTEIGTLLNSKVDKEVGKTLTSNDFTNTLKVKLEQLITHQYDVETETISFSHNSPVSYDEEEEEIVFAEI